METCTDRTNRHLAWIAELSDLTMQLARQAAQNAIDDPADPRHAMAFTRLATTTRQLIALEAKIAAPAPAKKGRADGTPAGTQPLNHNPERARVGRIVRDNLTRAIDGPSLKDVNRYLETRLHEPDVDRAIDSTEPIGVIARIICQEIGIPFDLAKQPDDVICRRPKPTP
jgi:hypothetical protein